jgi:hypothetical protein
MAHSVPSDTCPATSGQDVTVKVEEGLEAGLGEGPEPISFPEIKAESEVSCVCVFIITHFTTTVCTHVCCLFDIPICMTIILFIEWLLIMFLCVIGW